MFMSVQRFCLSGYNIIAAVNEDRLTKYKKVHYKNIYLQMSKDDIHFKSFGRRWKECWF